MPLPAPVMTAILAGRFHCCSPCLLRVFAGGTGGPGRRADPARRPAPTRRCRRRASPRRRPRPRDTVKASASGTGLPLQQPAEKQRGQRIAAACRLDRQTRGFDRPDAVGRGGEHREPVGAGSRLVTSTIPDPAAQCRGGGGGLGEAGDAAARQPFELESVRGGDVGHGECPLAVPFGDAGADIPPRPDIAHDRVAAIECLRVCGFDAGDDVEQHRARSRARRDSPTAPRRSAATGPIRRCLRIKRRRCRSAPPSPRHLP